MADAILRNRGALIFEGILFIVLGIIAIAVPWVFTFGFELVIAALFVIGGIASLIRTFKAKDIAGVFVSLLAAVLYLLIGLLMFAYPTYAVLSLTVLLAIFFVAHGIAQIIMSFDFKPAKGWGWFLFSGLLSVILGILIWFGLPGTAWWVLGLLIGINLLFFGISLLSIGAVAGKDEGPSIGNE